MKTRKQKVIFRILCTIVSIFLLASFFAVPVSALDQMTTYTIQNQIYEFGYPTNPPNDEFKPYSSLKLVYGEDDLTALDDYYSEDMEEPTNVSTYSISMSFEFDLEDNFALLSYFVDTFIWATDDVTISPNDTLFVNAGKMLVTLDSEMFSLSKCRFVIRNNANNYDFTFEDVVAATDVFDVYIDNNTISFDYPQMFFNIYDTFPSDNLALCVEFYGSSFYDNDRITQFTVSEFTIQYGVGKSPNYPIYPSAPGKDDVDGLGSAEHELIGSQQQGINQGLTIMGDTSTVLSNLNTSLQLGAFTTRLSGILDRIVSIPGLQALLQVSLSLGLFASLLALSASIVGAADRKAGQAKRDAARQSSAARRLADRKNKSR